MANNPQSSAAQPVWPPVVGSMPPQGFSAPFPMQFRPGMQGQPFAHISTAQQFRPVGQVQNVGMLHGQNQPPQFSQPMQQFPPRPANVAPASQPIPNPFIQTNMPIASSSPQPQQMGANMNNLMSVLGGPGVPFSSSYTFAPSSFGQTQNGMNPSSQFHAPVASAVGQTWLQPGSQSAPTVTHLQQATPQPPASVLTSSDWQEFEAAEGKRYYYNKVTRQSSWEKPLELMTPIEISWQVPGI